MDGRVRRQRIVDVGGVVGVGGDDGDARVGVDDGGVDGGAEADAGAGSVTVVDAPVGRRESVPWWEDGDVRHIARVRRPFPRPGQHVRALCGVMFRVRDGVLRGLPPDACPLCVLRR